MNMVSSATIHSSADVQSQKIGKGSRVWQYAVILSGAQVGDFCNICSHVFIENDVQIGDRVTIKCGVQLWDGIKIENDVFIGPNVTFSNDKFPRSGVRPKTFLPTTVSLGASIGAGSVILPGLSIGRNAMIGAGSVVTRDVPANAIVVGNPARIIGYVDTDARPNSELRREEKVEIRDSNVKGVKLHVLPRVTDMRGSLTVGEFSRTVPFKAKRYFMVYSVPSVETRGEHAHFDCEQFLVCARGSVSVVADDGQNREEFLLDRPEVGIYIPPLVWGIQYKYTPDALLLVFASQYYDPNDYIRDYNQFLSIVGE